MPLHGPTRLRSVFDAIGGIASIAVLLVGILVIVTVSERGRGTAGAGSSAAIAAASSDATIAPQPVATSELASDGPLPSADETPTPAPSSEPTPAPTPRPTRTPKPVVDPRPEGTPSYHLASGQLGATIVNGDMSIRVDRAAMPATFTMNLCGSADPEMQGYTEAFAFEVTESWTHWKSVSWVLEMGDHPYHLNWSEDAMVFANGQPSVVVTCHRPSDSTKIIVYSGPDDYNNPPQEYWWTIR